MILIFHKVERSDGGGTRILQLSSPIRLRLSALAHYCPASGCVPSVHRIKGENNFR